MAVTKTISQNGSKGNHKFTLKVEEKSTSTTNNTSDIKWSFKISPVNTGYNWSYSNTVPVTYTVTIGGKTYSGNIMSYDGSSTVTIKSGTRTIDHESDGAKSITIGFKVTSISSSYLPGSASKETTMDLTDIPRASSFGTISGNTIGNNMTVNISRKNDSFTHQLWYKLGDSAWYDLGTGIVIQKTFKISNDLLNQLPSSTNGTLQLCLRTYNGTTRVGDDVYKNVTVYVDDSVVPNVQSATITIEPNTYKVLLQNKNTLKITLSGFEAGTGSSIKSYTISGPGINVTTMSTTANTSTISSTGNLIYTVEVTDTRGRINELQSGVVICYPYFAPSFSKFTAYRVASKDSETPQASGNFICVKYTIKYAPVDGKNDITNFSFSGHEGEVTSTDWTFSSDGETAFKTKTSWINVGNNTKTYKIYATIADTYTSNIKSPTRTVLSASRILNIKSNGKGMAIGKMAEEDNLLDIAWNTRFNGSVYMPRNLIDVDLYAQQGGNNGEITLSQTVNNFKYIDIFFMDNNLNNGNAPNLGYIRHYVPASSTLTLSVTGSHQSNSSITYITRTRYTISGNKMTPNLATTAFVTLNGTSVSHSTGTNWIHIYKVIGIR